MAKILKGNYRLRKTSQHRPAAKAPSEPESLTKQFEDSALAKLGGSLCFVMKKKVFVWSGEPDASAGPSPR